jgi:hypothetical protein
MREKFSPSFPALSTKNIRPPQLLHNGNQIFRCALGPISAKCSQSIRETLSLLEIVAELAISGSSRG